MIQISIIPNDIFPDPAPGIPRVAEILKLSQIELNKTGNQQIVQFSFICFSPTNTWLDRDMETAPPGVKYGAHVNINSDILAIPYRRGLCPVMAMSYQHERERDLLGNYKQLPFDQISGVA